MNPIIIIFQQGGDIVFKENFADVTMKTIKNVHDNFVAVVTCIGPIWEPVCQPEENEEE